MANGGAVAGGVIMLIIAVLGYVFPITDTGYTIPQINDICTSGLGQIGQLFSGDAQKVCREYGYLTFGIYGFGLIGLILIIVGAAVSSSRKETEYIRTVEETEEDDSPIDLLKKRYAKGEISKEEFEKIKKDLENS